MAEIIDSSSYNNNSDQWIVMFNDVSTESGRKAHIDLVKRLNAHKAGNQNTRHYAGVTDVFDTFKGYAGELRPEVVAWIRSQGDIESVTENQEIRKS